MRSVNDSNVSEFARRLKDLLSPYKSFREASAALGIPEPTLTRLARGQNSPGSETLLKLAEKLNVSMSYLVGTDDDPRPHGAPGLRRPVAIDVAFIPRLDVRAAAGPGVDNEHHATEEHLAFPHWMLRKLGVGANSSRLRVIRARGDSMAPTFGDGALLLVNEAETTPPQKASPRRHDLDIFVFLFDGALRAKRLRKKGSELLVLSDNRDYDVEIFRGSELKRVEIIGRVIWWDDRL